MFKIKATVWKNPGEDKMCEIVEVEITEDEILELAVARAKEQTGWTDDDIYNSETVSIIP